MSTVVGTNGKPVSYHASAHNLAGVIRRVVEDPSNYIENTPGIEGDISNALQSHQSGRKRGIAIPIDVMFGRRRSLGSSNGASLVTTNMAPTVEWTDVLRRKAVAAALGVRFFSAYERDKPIAVPTKTTATSAQWIAEYGAPTASFPDFTVDEQAGKPKTIAATMVVPRRLWNLGDGDVNEYLYKDLQDGIAAELDRAIIAGAGGLEPIGVLNVSGIPMQPIGDDGGPPTRAMLLSAQRTVAVANGDSSATARMGWLTSPQGEHMLRSTDGSTGTAGAWLWSDEGRILGKPAMSTTSVLADGTKGSGEDLTPLVYGNWGDVFVNVNPAVTIIVNPYASGVGDGSTVRVTAILDVKVLVRHTASFVIIPDMATS